jgi:hypothetical protein
MRQYLSKLIPVKAGDDVTKVASASRMNAIMEMLRALARGENIKTGPNMTRGGNDCEISIDANPRGSRTPGRLKQFTARVAEDKLEMNFGQVYGLGMVGAIPSPLVDQEFAEIGDSESNPGAWLRIEFTPESEPYNIFYDGVESTFYAISGGGTDGNSTIIVQTEQPTDQLPDVDSDTGDATINGIFHVRLAQVSGASSQNDLYGPLSVSFCPPSSVRIWESVV